MDISTAQIVSAGFLIFRRTPVTRLYEIENPAETHLPGVDQEASRLQFLLMKHANRWDLPKGHIDDGETIEQAAIRELHEETGIEYDAIWHDPVFRYVQFYDVTTKKNGIKRKQLVLYLGWLKKDRTIYATEHLGHQWFDWLPPHKIQEQTIDPLMQQVAEHFAKNQNWPYNGSFTLQ
jgi:bis(5'-nucleosidyl)-tetraphosphatase